MLCLISPAGTAFTADAPQRIELGKEKCCRHHHPKEKSHHKNQPKVIAKCCDSSAYYQAFQPTYYIKGIGADGSSIALTDESIWTIAASSAPIACRWTQNTPILITPSHWYSQYRYYLVNKLTSESVTAKLSQGPFRKYSILIDHIDQCHGFVYLSNGTRWLVSPDWQFSSWKTHQAVLIGENNSWFGNPYILININENNYVTASLLP